MVNRMETRLHALESVGRALERFVDATPALLRRYGENLEAAERALRRAAARLRTAIEAASRKSDEEGGSSGPASLHHACRALAAIESAERHVISLQETLAGFKQEYAILEDEGRKQLNRYTDAVCMYLSIFGSPHSAAGTAATAVPEQETAKRCIAALGGHWHRFAAFAWHAASEEERAAALHELAVDAGRALGVPIRGVRFYYGPADERGEYGGDGWLYLNRDTIEDPRNRDDALDTIFHEGRHAFQDYAARDPEAYGISRETAARWQWNFEHYIHPRRNRFAYFNQPIERDARAFAAGVLAGFVQEGERHDRIA